VPLFWKTRPFRPPRGHARAVLRGTIVFPSDAITAVRRVPLRARKVRRGVRGSGNRLAGALPPLPPRRLPPSRLAAWGFSSGVLSRSSSLQISTIILCAPPAAQELGEDIH